MKQPNKEHSNSPRVEEGCKSEMPVHKVKSHKEAEPSLDTHTPSKGEPPLNRVGLAKLGENKPQRDTPDSYDSYTIEPKIDEYEAGLLDRITQCDFAYLEVFTDSDLVLSQLEAYRKGKEAGRKEAEDIYKELIERLEGISVAQLWSDLVKENRILKKGAAHD